MTNPEEQKLIEAMARAKCAADGEYDPDDDESMLFESPTKAWEMFYHDAKCHLAMHKAIERHEGLEELQRLGQEFDNCDKDTDK